MATVKLDLRILKTRKAIKESFLKLVVSKGYERITVQDIASEAMINRNTFYLHYVDKPDLMDHLCQESMEKLNVCLGYEFTSIEEIDRVMFLSMLRNLFEAIEDDIIFFKVMLTQNGLPSFSTHLKDALKTAVLSGLGNHQHNKQLNVGFEYAIAGLVGVICLWITEPENYEAEDLIKQMSELHFNNVLDLLKMVS